MGIRELGLLGASFCFAACSIGPAPREVRIPETPSDISSYVRDMEELGFQILTEKELQELLVGHSVTAASGVSTKYVEIFFPAGEYRVLGHRNTMQIGSYEIRSNTVCTKIAARPERCSIFAVDRSGRYFRKGMGSEYGPVEPIVVGSI